MGAIKAMVPTTAATEAMIAKAAIKAMVPTIAATEATIAITATEAMVPTIAAIEAMIAKAAIKAMVPTIAATEAMIQTIDTMAAGEATTWYPPMLNVNACRTHHSIQTCLTLISSSVTVTELM